MDGEWNDEPRLGPEGTTLLRGAYGAQIRTTKGHRWSDEAEAVFLDQLAATCNVTLAAQACGFSHAAIYRRRANDPGFMKRWDRALAQGYAHLETLIVRRAVDALEGVAPDPQAAVRIPEVTMRDALAALAQHRRRIEGGPRSKRDWTRPRTLDEVSESILRKLEAIAPEPVPLVIPPQAEAEAGPLEQTSAGSAPDERETSP